MDNLEPRKGHAGGNQKIIKIFLFSLGLQFFLNSPIFAAEFVFPASVEPGRVSRELTPTPKLPQPGQPSLVSGEKKEPSNFGPEAEKIHFKLVNVVIQNNHVYPTAELIKIFQPSFNHKISLADLEKMVEQVTTKYRTDGYILSRAILPPQKIDKGIVIVKVIEGYVSQVTVTGDPGLSRSILENYGQKILRLRPLQVRKLESYMLLANDLPGLKVSSVITPSKTMPDSADLALVTERKRGAAYLAYDNYGTRYLGPQQTTVNASLFSLLAPGDSNTARFVVTSKTKELKYGELAHTQPLGKTGINLLAGGNYTETRPEYILSPLEIIGRNLALYVDLSYPLIRSRLQNLSIHSLLNYQNVTSTILGTPFYQDRIRSLALGVSYNKTDNWKGINDLSFDVIHGFPFFGAQNHFYQSRPFGNAVYTRITFNVSRLQELNSRFSLLAVIHSQYAFEPLLATEQFGVGGPEIGRGYDPSEIVADRGLSGKLELRMNTYPGLRFLNAVQIYGFYDAGVVWNANSTFPPNRQDLSSTGIGARVDFMPHLSGNVFIAKPLSKKVAVFQVIGANGEQARVFFQLVANI